jgi:integrase
VIAFAIFSTRRQDEICRIVWSDLDEEGSRVLVRDMKDPDKKEGNDVWCELPPDAMNIIKSMPRVSDQIFPYNADAVSAAFTRACSFLGIPDLRFHDLRHDGISRLFEMGKNIPQAACVSGHRSWSSLQRYTHIRQTGDKYAGWEWLSLVTAEVAGTP